MLAEKRIEPLTIVFELMVEVTDAAGLSDRFGSRGGDSEWFVAAAPAGDGRDLRRGERAALVVRNLDSSVTRPEGHSMIT
ncbi:hypothetical protein ACQPZ2_19260 [Nocardia pseudovaccinii]|uniref:hypothetical protein n=1 Tax=Nocardia pseudovaccinii TaxID=189540 RepID=UPI003D936448